MTTECDDRPRPSVALVSAAPVLLWGLGTVFGESLSQVGLYAALLLTLWHRRRFSLPPDVRTYVLASGAYAAYQAVSPALALLSGVATVWPRSGRYGQFADTFAGALAALLGQLSVPWGALGLVALVAWVSNVWVGAFQHFVPWPFGQPFWVRAPVERVHENFAVDGPPRFGAGGWLFHRLRFGHGAVALLGPSLAWARRPGRWRVGALLLAVHLILAPYLGFTRAALGVALLLVGTTAIIALTGRARLWAGAAMLLLVGLMLSNPGWRARLVQGVDNLAGGERASAMRAGLELVRAHPLLGVGFGNHQRLAFATAERTHVTEYLATDSHNVLLTVWAETGLLGVVLWLTMHATWLRAALRRARAGSPWALGGLLSWLGFQALGLVHYLPYHTGVHLSFALVWGLALAPWREGGEGGGQRTP
jgi:O-antigen ligase